MSEDPDCATFETGDDFRVQYQVRKCKYGEETDGQ